MTVDDATWLFVDEHQTDDVRQLALKKNKYPHIDFEFALRQIHGLQKAKLKLPSFFVTPHIIFPPSVSMEQCSSEKTARYKADLVSGDTMADLSGGFGVDCVAFSTKFHQCHYVEPQATLCDIMSYNLKQLHVNHVLVHQTNMEDFIDTINYCDFFYVDPSRRDVNGNRVVTLEDCIPNIIQHKEKLLSKATMLMVKMSPMLDIKRTLSQLPETKSVHVLAVDGECKELLFLLEKDFVGTPEFVAENMKNDHSDRLKFSMEEEVNAVPDFIEDELGRYLYEPNAAVMKAGAFKLLSERYSLKKLQMHSHLYTSDKMVEGFPGRIFQVYEVIPFNRKDLKEKMKEVKKANVAVRNFPLSAEDLKKQLKLEDGGMVYIYGTTLRGERKVIIRCGREK